MPFKKISGNKYEGPSGRKFNLKQVRMYYAGGFNKSAGKKKP